MTPSLLMRLLESDHHWRCFSIFHGFSWFLVGLNGFSRYFHIFYFYKFIIVNTVICLISHHMTDVFEAHRPSYMIFSGGRQPSVQQCDVRDVQCTFISQIYCQHFEHLINQHIKHLDIFRILYDLRGTVNFQFDFTSMIFQLLTNLNCAHESRPHPTLLELLNSPGNIYSTNPHVL